MAVAVALDLGFTVDFDNELDTLWPYRSASSAETNSANERGGSRLR